MKLNGNCPMGCGQTLARTISGTIRCTSPECLEPLAVDMLLRDVEIDHIVAFDAAGYTVRHPLWERLHTHLVDCRFHEELNARLDGPPGPPGCYRAQRAVGAPDWTFTPVEEGNIHG